MTKKQSPIFKKKNPCQRKTSQNILEGSVQREPTNDMILSHPLTYLSRDLRLQNSCIDKVKSKNSRWEKYKGDVHLKEALLKKSGVHS